jgi:hypothetical protein
MAAAKGKDLETFRSLHDKSFIVPKKIRDGLAALGDSWEYEVEFLKRCSLANQDLAMYRDQFADFYVDTPGRNPKRVWAGSKKFATQLRERLQ